MNKLDVVFFSRVFGALADPTRQHILELLQKEREMTVASITSNFTLAQPTISQHLRVLKDVGVITARKSGQQTYYKICNEKIYDAMKKFMSVYESEVNSH